MKGTRPLDNNEIMLVSACFDGAFAARNRGLFMLGVSTDGRILEMSPIQVGVPLLGSGESPSLTRYSNCNNKGR